MNFVVVADIVCLIFISMLIVAHLLVRDKGRSSRIMLYTTFVIFFWTLADIISYTVKASAVLDLLAYTGGSFVAFMFMFYCEAYISEKTKLEPWIFLIPKIICLACAALTAVAFLMGKIVVYDENGYMVEEYGTPFIVQIGLGISLLFPPVVALVKRATAGKKCIFIMGIFGLAPFIATAAYRWLKADLTLVIDAVSLMAIYVFLQTDSERNNFRERSANEILLKNYARFFTLTDNFESLYDIDLESGQYSMLTRGEFFRNNITDKLNGSGVFFEELQKDTGIVVYEEDREKLCEVLEREAIREELKDREHFDFHYRLIGEDGPVWMRIRLVYKDEKKEHLIIGVFNAEEEFKAKEKEAAQLKATEYQLRHEQLRVEVSRKLAEYDDDPIMFFNPYAEKLRDLTGCDRVIYRDMDDIRIMVLSDAVSDHPEILDQCCKTCEFLDVSNPIFEEGYVEVDDCHEGWEGSSIQHNCCIRSLMTRLVYCNGMVAGYLSIQYINDFHKFSDVERATLEDLSHTLSLALSRYDAGKKAGELSSVKRTLSMMFSLSDQFDPIIVLEPESGAFEWYQSSIHDGKKITSMTLKGDDYYANIREKNARVIMEDDKAAFLDFYSRENMMNIAETGEGESLEVRCHEQPDGSYLWRYNKAVRMIDENGKAFIVIGLIDTTETKRKEEQIKETYAQLDEANRRNMLLHQAVRAAIWTYDVDEHDEVTAIHFIDREDRNSELSHRSAPGSWLDAVHPDDREAVLRESRAAIRDHSGNTPYEITYRALLPNGQMMWLKTSGRLIHLEDGTPKLYGISVDITKQIENEREQQRQLEIARKRADDANLAKTNFLFSMSHDIRTPLNAIRGFTTMAKKHAGEPEKIKDYLEKIDISGEQLLSLINQVLEMARIESGKTQLNLSRIDINREFETTVEVFSEQAKARDLNFCYEFSAPEHNFVFADEAKMSSITLNLIGNAIKYTPNGGTIKLSLKEVPCSRPGYATYVFIVSDTGIGISEEFISQLYEPFSRENNFTVSKIPGTGLGLSIVKNTVDFLGGDIKVYSESGKGTRFEVSIDLKIDEETKESEAPVVQDQFTGSRILLVEDNEMNREIAKDMLEDYGFIIEDAEDGDVAIDMVKKRVDSGDYGYYDYILMDVQMPRVNGYEATKAIRAMAWPENTYVPIIALTANAFEEDRQNALNAGMDEHLAKPIDIKKLFYVLSRFV